MLGVRSQVRWETVGFFTTGTSRILQVILLPFQNSEYGIYQVLLVHCRPLFPHAKCQGCTADVVPAHTNLKHLLDTATHLINQGTGHATWLALLLHCSAETWEGTESSRSIRVASVLSQSNRRTDLLLLHSWHCPTSQRGITCTPFIPPLHLVKSQKKFSISQKHKEAKAWGKSNISVCISSSHLLKTDLV